MSKSFTYPLLGVVLLGFGLVGFFGVGKWLWIYGFVSILGLVLFHTWKHGFHAGGGGLEIDSGGDSFGGGDGGGGGGD